MNRAWDSNSIVLISNSLYPSLFLAWLSGRLDPIGRTEFTLTRIIFYVKTYWRKFLHCTEIKERVPIPESFLSYRT